MNGIPERYNRSGRLSFFVDDSLTVRSGDHKGEFAPVGTTSTRGRIWPRTPREIYQAVF